MTDEKMLELAAKAAGMRGFWVDAGLNVGSDAEPLIWNPLTDDGDALRLAVKLKLAIRPLDKCVFVESDPETLLGQSSVSELEMYGRPSEPDIATRRAIVRAAAEIGRAMP